MGARNRDGIGLSYRNNYLELLVSLGEDDKLGHEGYVDGLLVELVAILVASATLRQSISQNLAETWPTTQTNDRLCRLYRLA
jgi:hypothetical protein